MVNNSQNLQLVELKDMISQLNISIQNLNSIIKNLQDENSKLQSQLAWYQKNKFAPSSEKHAVGMEGQLSLFEDENLDKPVELIEPEIVEVKKKVRKKKATLEEQFKNLPTRQIHVDTLTDADKICSLCGNEMLPIGTEIIRTELVYQPPRLERIEYIATTYACPACKDSEEPQFIKDNGTPALIKGSYVSPSLLANIIYSKYGLYIPLYRKEKDFLQLQAPINRTSMAHWIIYSASEYLKPLYDYFHRELLKRSFLMMDETPVQILKEDGRKA